MTAGFDKSAATLAYVRFILDTLRLSPTALAKLAGISPTTLTRPLNNPTHKFALSTSTLQKLAKATGVNPAPFFDAESFAARQIAPFYRVDTWNEELWGPQPMWEPPVTLTVTKVALGVWHEAEASIGAWDVPIYLTHTDYYPFDCFACLVADESSNMVAAPGELLFCIRYEAFKKFVVRGGKEHEDYIHQGMFVILERYIENGRLIEISTRTGRLVDGRWELRPAMDRPYPQSSVVLLDTLDGSNAAHRVVGVVEYVVRHPGASAKGIVERVDELERVRRRERQTLSRKRQK